MAIFFLITKIPLLDSPALFFLSPGCEISPKKINYLIYKKFQTHQRTASLVEGKKTPVLYSFFQIL
jgi:hypothetical protein